MNEILIASISMLLAIIMNFVGLYIGYSSLNLQRKEVKQQNKNMVALLEKIELNTRVKKKI